MKITQFIRERSDVELARLMTSGLRWDWFNGSRYEGEDPTKVAGCILCNTFDIRVAADVGYHEIQARFGEVEDWYMDAARARGDGPVGGLVARLATREMGRRALAAIGSLPLPESAREAVAR